jgi:hypothetical protein
MVINFVINFPRGRRQGGALIFHIVFPSNDIPSNLTISNLDNSFNILIELRSSQRKLNKINCSFKCFIFEGNQTLNEQI